VREVVFSSRGDVIRAPQAADCGSRSFLVSGVVSGWKFAADPIFCLLFPSNCRLCAEPLLAASLLPVCAECLASVRPLTGEYCVVCGQRLLSPYLHADSSPEAARCGLCRRAEMPFAQARAYGSYEGRLRELIHLLKFDRVRPAANALGKMLAPVMASFVPEAGAAPLLVIPVPLHRTRLRERGFNHAELMARAACKRIVVGTRLKVEAGILERRRETPPQIGLTAHQRRANLRGAFGVRHPEAVRDRTVLLVDDVMTTGATAAECARVLRRAGAKQVLVATVARTLLGATMTEVPGVQQTAA
jgi:ComF family protein